MKKKEIIASLISITVGAIILAVGWHKLASTSRNNLISCKHVDENIDMICDSCGASLSFKDYAFEQELKKKVPAHIKLVVTRNYATWNEIKNNYASWDSIKALNNWKELKLWIAQS